MSRFLPLIAALAALAALETFPQAHATSAAGRRAGHHQQHLAATHRLQQTQELAHRDGDHIAGRGKSQMLMRKSSAAAEEKRGRVVVDRDALTSEVERKGPYERQYLPLITNDDEGTPCWRNNECESGTCKGNMWGARRGKCTPLPQKKANGEPCKENHECQTGLCKGNWFSRSKHGTCRQPSSIRALFQKKKKKKDDDEKCVEAKELNCRRANY